MHKNPKRYAQSMLLLLPLWGAACAPSAPEGDAGTPGSDASVTPPADAGGEVDAGLPPGDAGAQSDGGSTVISDGGGSTGDYDNEDCSSAAIIYGGDTVSASTEGAEDDHSGSCGGSGGADLVYQVTLDEPSGLVIEAEGYDMVMYVTQNGCSGQDEVEDGCVDGIGTTEYLAFDLLPAGDYNIVIDTYVLFDSAGDDFSLSVQVYPGGYCTGDYFDPDNADSEEAPWLGTADIDTQNLDPDAEDPVSVDLVLCSEDTDFFSFGHMGGTLAVELTPMMAGGTLQGELFAAVLSEDSEPTLGEKIQDLPVGPNATIERGVYFVKITGENVPGLGDSYGLKLEHACQPDEGDSASPLADDSEYERVVLDLNRRPAEPIVRYLCGNDVDSMVVEVRFPVDLKIDLLGGSALNYEIYEVITQDGEESLNAYTGVVNPTSAGSDLQLTLPNVPENTRLYVKTFLAPDAPFTPVEYRVDLIFGDPPANGDCSSAQSLSVDPTAAATLGSTLNGQSQLVGPCNGEEDDVAGTAEVFYTFTVPGDFDTDITFDGSLDPDASDLDFEGSVYLFQYPGSCPVDLAELIPVLVDPDDATSDPLCQTGIDFRMRIPQMPAGEYLMVVDGYYNEFFGSVTRTDGRFEISVKSYPNGFPPPLACIEAVNQVLPGAGASISVELDTSTGSNEFTFEDYGCFTFGARGKEKVISFTPDSDMVVDIETSGDVDTMIVLREGSCVTTIEDADLVCDDDGGGSFGGPSKISNQALSANTEYFLFVDGYSISDEGIVTVTITVQ